MKGIRTKREREKAMVSQMIALYCKKKHGGTGLCPECAALDAYARQQQRQMPIYGDENLLLEL